MLTAFIWLKVVKQQHCEIILQFKNIHFHIFKKKQQNFQHYSSSVSHDPSETIQYSDLLLKKHLFILLKWLCCLISLLKP